MTEAASFSPTQAPPADPTRTVFFGIPLKARVTARNWSNTVRDFNRTLASIYNQTNPNFRVLVGCHEVPDLMFPTDHRLKFLRIQAKPPKLHEVRWGLFSDRAQKLRAIGKRFNREGGRWFMALDADDLVSSRLVEFVLGNPNPVGYIVRKGFILDQQTGAMAPLPSPNVSERPFDQHCNSSAILRLEEGDFSSKDDEYGGCRFARHAASPNHMALWRLSIKEDRPVTPLPFRAVTYVVNTGDNHSFEHRPDLSGRKERLIPAINSQKIIDDEQIRAEFALDHPVWDRRHVHRRPIHNRPAEDGWRIDFIGCGALKSGTSTLTHYIKSHTAIGTARRKEVHYFDVDSNFPPEGPDYTQYHNQFLRKSACQVYGEITPAYMYFPKALMRIHAYSPKIKLLAILRNPIERAFSHYQMEVREDREKLTFGEAIAREGERTRAMAPKRNRVSSYLDRGFYTEQIRAIWRLFPPEQVLLLKLDDLRDDPQRTMNRVFEFLDVQPMSLPETRIVNEGGYTEEPASEEREFLRRTFEYEIRALERMLGWDCSSWLT